MVPSLSTSTTLAPSAPLSPSLVSPGGAAPPSGHAGTSTTASPATDVGFFDPHFELPEIESGLVEPGAYDDFNPLPSLSFPPLPFTLPPDDLTHSRSSLAAPPSLLFPSPSPSHQAPSKSLFSFTESSALASFLTSSSDEPVLPASTSIAVPTSTTDDSFANLVASRGAWDFNPRLPDFMPVFGKEGGGRSASSSLARSGQHLDAFGDREETSRRLSGMRISPAPFGSSFGGDGRGSTSGRSSSFDHHPSSRSRTPRGKNDQQTVSRHASLERPPVGYRRPSPSAIGDSQTKSRSSSTTVADLLALDRLGRDSARLPSAGGFGFGMDIWRTSGGQGGGMGRTAMEVSASTDVFDSPDLPTAALPSLARMDQVAANDVDHRMTDDDDHDGEAGLASHSNSSGSTVILDQEMSHSSPPSAPSPLTAEAVHPAPPSTSIDKRLPSPTKVANGLSSETVPAGPARSSKRIRATPSTSTRRSSTSLSTSPEISQGPLPKRRKGSTAGSTNGKSTKSAGAAAAPVKREVVEAGEDGLMDELEEELDEMDGEGEKKPKVLLTAEQKRTNHILSEQKRRNAIRTGYAELSHLLSSSQSLPFPPFDPSAPTAPPPRSGTKSVWGGARGGSKSNMLGRAASLCRFLEDGNAGLEQEIRRLEKLVGGRR